MQAALAAEAIEIARAADDPAALAHTLAHAAWAIWVPDTLRERQRLTDELVDLARSLDDPSLSFLAGFRRCAIGIEGGDRASAESGLATMRSLAASVPQPHMGWFRLIFESAWACVQGDLQAAEQHAIHAFEVGTAAGNSDALSLFGGQLTAIRSLQGRLGELAEQVVELAGQPDSVAGWRAAAALALIEGRREDEARELALAEDFQSIPWDQASSAAMFLWADVCSRLRLADRSGELYELLAPFAGQLAAPPGNVRGTFAWVLGTLAAILERYEESERHFATAAAIDEHLGAPVFLAHARSGWARALIARGRPEDLERAQPMLEQAEKVAGRLGAGRITREVEVSRAALSATGA